MNREQPPYFGGICYLKMATNEMDENEFFICCHKGINTLKFPNEKYHLIMTKWLLKWDG
jgi:hypothetical protein